MSEIWVVAEHRAGTVERVTFELLGEARRLAREMKAEVGAVALGEKVATLGNALANYGADTLYAVEDPRLRHYDPELYVSTVGHLCRTHQPPLVLFPATSTGSDLAARLALQNQWPLAPRCVNFHLRHGELEMVRPIADQKAHAVLLGAAPGPRLATVAPDVIGIERPDLSRTARVVNAEVVEPERRKVEVREFIAGDPKTLDITEAEIVVAAGRGLGSKQNMRLVEELAIALGGSVGGTRVVVDLGWLPRERQVGQTGKNVTPKLYIACGISGATQHTIGMKESGTIVAINTDPGAPIFKIADLALEGDVVQILPVLAEHCQQERRKA